MSIKAGSDQLCKVVLTNKMTTGTLSLDLATYYSLATLTKINLLSSKVKSLFGESSRENGRSGQKKKEYRSSVLECLSIKRSI